MLQGLWKESLVHVRDCCKTRSCAYQKLLMDWNTIVEKLFDSYGVLIEAGLGSLSCAKQAGRTEKAVRIVHSHVGDSIIIGNQDFFNTQKSFLCT